VINLLLGGLVAGTLDIAYACIFWGIRNDVPAQRIFQSVARGALGEAAFEGGWGTAILGLGFHYFIATSMCVAYYLVAKRWSPLRERPVPLGIVYGVLLYAIMNFVVLPLSAAGPPSKNTLWVVLSVLVHMFLIGLPCALFAVRALSSNRNVEEGRPG
jgi:hypothetical protein